MVVQGRVVLAWPWPWPRGVQSWHSRECLLALWRLRVRCKAAQGPKLTCSFVLWLVGLNLEFCIPFTDLGERKAIEWAIKLSTKGGGGGAGGSCPASGRRMCCGPSLFLEKRKTRWQWFTKRRAVHPMRYTPAALNALPTNGTWSFWKFREN